MARHPAGKGARAQDGCSPDYVVKKGDTLWGIADRVTDGNAGHVSERVSSIYRANRAAIGSDPDLILPGQTLSLPGECAR